MKYLLDTCVISELVKKFPNEKVVAWLTEQNENDLFICVLTFGEIEKGIEKAADIRRKENLTAWVENDLKMRFQERILSIDLEVANQWGRLQGASESIGKPMSSIDGLIAVTGLVNNCTVVTRNTSDMEQSTVKLFNPWK